MKHARTSRILPTLLIVGAAVSAMPLGGCYTRVTNTKGINGSRHTVQDPYRSETFLDKAFDSLLNPQPSSGFKSADSLSRDASITAPAPPKKSATAYDGGGKYPR